MRLEDFGFLIESDVKIPNELDSIFRYEYTDQSDLFFVGAFSEKQKNDALRKELFKLHYYTNSPIRDLGDLDYNLEKNKRNEAIRVLVSELLIKGKNLLFQTDQESDVIEIYKAYQKAEQWVAVSNVSSDLSIAEGSVFQQITCHSPNYLYHYSLLASQAYFLGQATCDLLSHLSFSNLRLGELRGKALLTEPYIRNTDLLTLNLNCLKASEVLDENNSPNGLYAEDLCQIAHYAGLSDQVNVVATLNTSPLATSTSFKMMAQTLWSFLESYAKRCGDYPLGSFKNYKKFTIMLEGNVEELEFLQSNVSGRWWVKAPKKLKSQTPNNRHALIPCNFEDYQNAINGVLPECWWTEALR